MVVAQIPEPLRRYLLAQKRFDLEILKDLEEAAKDVRNRITKLRMSTVLSDRVRAAQLRVVLAEIRNEQLAMFLAIGDEIRAGQMAAATVALDDTVALAQLVFSGLPRDAANEVIESLRASGRAGINNLYARTPRALSERLYADGVLSSGELERIIRNGIVRAASARELATDVYRFVSPTAPGGASFVAMRLARTEINNAFHNQQIQSLDVPGVLGAKWNLSGSHPRPDECNRLAESDQYNMGAGVFPRGKVPGKPHPQCLCFLTFITVTPKQFVKDVRAGKYDDELRRRYNANLEALKGVPAAPAKAAAKKATTTAKATTPKKTTAPKVTAPKPQPVPEFAQPYHTSIKGIEDIAATVEKETITAVKALTGGVSADTELVTFSNGKQLVRKSAGNPGAEHASSVIGRALDVDTPRVYRNHPGEVFMDYIPNAKTAAELKIRDPAFKWRETAASAEGQRIGFFDLLINNVDRNTGNWMVTDAKKIISIDYSHAHPIMIGDRPHPLVATSSIFTDALFKSPKSMRLTSADLDWAQRRIEAIGPELIHMGQRNFLDYALAVINKMRPLAHGTTNILAKG